MIMKIISRLQNVCTASKISILVSSIVSILLFAFATAMSIAGGNMEIKYLYEYMAKVATDIFAMGIFLGLSGEFLAIIIDTKRK